MVVFGTFEENQYMPFCTYSQLDLVHMAADMYLAKHQNHDACHGVGLPASLKDEVPLHSALHHTQHHLMNHYHYLSIHPQKLHLPLFCLQSHFWSETKYLSSIFHHLCNYMAQTSTCFKVEENK
jgi:hypothetical protein